MFGGMIKVFVVCRYSFLQFRKFQVKTVLDLSIYTTTGLKRNVKIFSVDFNPIDTNNILDIHRHLKKQKQCKMLFGIIKKYSLYY